MITPDEYFDKCKFNEVMCHVDTIVRCIVRNNHREGKLFGKDKKIINGYPFGSYEHNVFDNEARKIMGEG